MATEAKLSREELDERSPNFCFSLLTPFIRNSFRYKTPDAVYFRWRKASGVVRVGDTGWGNLLFCALFLSVSCRSYV